MGPKPFFLRVDIQHNQCPCRFFRFFHSREIQVLWSQKYNHRDTTILLCISKQSRQCNGKSGSGGVVPAERYLRTGRDTWNWESYIPGTWYNIIINFILIGSQQLHVYSGQAYAYAYAEASIHRVSGNSSSSSSWADWRSTAGGYRGIELQQEYEASSIAIKYESA